MQSAVVTAVNSLRTVGKSPRLDLWASRALVLPAPSAELAESMTMAPEVVSGATEGSKPG